MNNEKQQIDEMAKIAEEAIDNQTVGNCPFFPCPYKDSSVCCDVCHTINALYNAGYRKQEWISVEDRLPEEKDTERKFYDNESLALLDVEIQRVSDEVLVVVKDIGGEFAFVSTDCTIEGKWQSWENGDYTVTHWMPFPEAPKMKGGAE